MSKAWDRCLPVWSQDRLLASSRTLAISAKLRKPCAELRSLRKTPQAMCGVEVSPQESPQNPVPVEERGTLEARNREVYAFQAGIIANFCFLF